MSSLGIFKCIYVIAYVSVKHPINVFTFSSGKVHGSLARAGKVRGQTPKVISVAQPQITCFY